MPDKRDPAIEAYAEVGQYYKLLKLKEMANRLRLCYSKTEGLMEISRGECWCRGAKEGGGDLPCP